MPAPLLIDVPGTGTQVPSLLLKRMQDDMRLGDLEVEMCAQIDLQCAKLKAARRASPIKAKLMRWILRREIDPAVVAADQELAGLIVRGGELAHARRELAEQIAALVEFTLLETDDWYGAAQRKLRAHLRWAQLLQQISAAGTASLKHVGQARNMICGGRGGSASQATAKLLEAAADFAATAASLAAEADRVADGLGASPKLLLLDLSAIIAGMRSLAPAKFQVEADKLTAFWDKKINTDFAADRAEMTAAADKLRAQANARRESFLRALSPRETSQGHR